MLPIFREQDFSETFQLFHFDVLKVQNMTKRFFLSNPTTETDEKPVFQMRNEFFTKDISFLLTFLTISDKRGVARKTLRKLCLESF